MNATIRPATVRDAEAVSALVLGLVDAFLAPPPDYAAAAAFLATIAPDATAERLADPAFRYHVAEEDGALVGVVGVRGGTHLYHLFVAERGQGRGLASRLWRAALLDAGSAIVTVNASLNAVGLYQRFGFAAAGDVVRTDGLAFLPMARPVGGSSRA